MLDLTTFGSSKAARVLSDRLNTKYANDLNLIRWVSNHCHSAAAGFNDLLEHYDGKHMAFLLDMIKTNSVNAVKNSSSPAKQRCDEMTINFMLNVISMYHKRAMEECKLRKKNK